MWKRFLLVVLCIFIAGIALSAVKQPPGKEKKGPAARPNGKSGIPIPITPDPPPAKNEVLYTPYEAARLVLNDAKAFAAAGAIDATAIRYLSLHNFTPDQRLRLKQTVDFVVNSLSTRRTIVRTAAIPRPEDPIVVRVQLRDYGISPSAWDGLAATGSGRVPLPESYFHSFTATKTDVFENRRVSGRDEFGRETVSTRKVKVGVKKILASGPAPWLSIEDKGATMTELVKLLGSPSPILRADWFITYALWSPAYYSLLGLTTDKEEDFSKLVALDRVRASKNLIAAVANSQIVTLNNRLLTRYPTVSGYTAGYYWESHDTDTGIDAEDYIANVANTLTPKFTAKEIIATLPNTLQAYALANNAGKLLNVAVANIAIHGDTLPTILHDKQIYAGRNCVICHNLGIHKIDDRVRKLAQGNVALLIVNSQVKDRSLAEKLADAFGPSIDGVVVHDRQIYAAAIKACNGLTPQDNAKQYEEFVWEYLDMPITLNKAAREAGIQPKELEAWLKKGVNIDYALTGWLQDPPINASRVHWERDGHANMMTYLIAVRPKNNPSPDEE